MDTSKLMDDEIDLTNVSFWKPIYQEIKRILEQRDLFNATVGTIRRI